MVKPPGISARIAALSASSAGRRDYPMSTPTMEISAHDERDRATARRIQASHQDADRAAVGGDRGDVVLGLARLGQITMRKVDGWQTLPEKPSLNALTWPPDAITS